MPGIAALNWTDSVGAASLTNGKPNPWSRFQQWIVDPRSVNSAVEGLGSGTVHVWRFREDYEAGFNLVAIPLSSQALIERFIRHARSFGVFEVVTDDASSRTYPTCQCPPDALPARPDFDRQPREYTLSLVVRNVAAVPVPMLCIYP